MHIHAQYIIPTNSLITFEIVTTKIVSQTLVPQKFIIIILSILKTIRTVSKLYQNGLNSVAVLICCVCCNFLHFCSSLTCTDFQQWPWLHMIQTETVSGKINLIWAFVWKAFLSFSNVVSSYLWKKWKQAAMVILAYFLSFRNLSCFKTDGSVISMDGFFQQEYLSLFFNISNFLNSNTF